MTATGKEKGTIRAACAVAVACMLAGAACLAQEAEERPKIFLEKKVYSSASETGKRVFYETRTVAGGDTLWKILTSRGDLSAKGYAAQVKEFRRMNPSIRNLDRLVPGQRIQVPLPPAGATAIASKVREGGTVAHTIAKGESLMRILRAHGVAEKALPKYVGAVKSLNPSIRNADLILAGRTIHLPTEAYFGPPGAASPEEPAGETAMAAGTSPRMVDAPPPAASLTREAPAGNEEVDLAAGKPGAELAPPPSASGEPPQSSATAASPPPSAGAPASERPPYRGLLTDVVSALGEKWIDRGTLY
ncbi:MAG TPA: LysM peptidoglycan-binding domain-containing protein, partial [Candidatus Deferrimicrobiaceae bacterium]